MTDRSSTSVQAGRVHASLSSEIGKTRGGSIKPFARLARPRAERETTGWDAEAMSAAVRDVELAGIGPVNHSRSCMEPSASPQSLTRPWRPGCIVPMDGLGAAAWAMHVPAAEVSFNTDDAAKAAIPSSCGRCGPCSPGCCCCCCCCCCSRMICHAGILRQFGREHRRRASSTNSG